MLQANTTASTFGSYAPPATYGRPKRGTPDYAAAVRRQIAHLAALHAATVAEAPPLPPVVTRTVLLVSACPKVRAAVSAGLRDAAAVDLVTVGTLDEGRAQLMQGSPNLVLVDDAQNGLLAGLMQEAQEHRVVLIANTVPRSCDLPRELAGVLARPLKAERVSRQVLSLLDEQR
jgi:hypothetical protein